MKKIFLLITCCCMINVVAAEETVVKEETTPPSQAEALSPDQIPPILSISKPVPTIKAGQEAMLSSEENMQG
jgi:hypothetical protein